MFRQPLTIQRRGTGAYIDGVWQDGPTVELQIRASVQPATAEDMQSLPEGRRTGGAYRLYTDTELRSAEVDERNPDRLILFGAEYEIASLERWQNGVLPHYKAIATRAAP